MNVWVCIIKNNLQAVQSHPSHLLTSLTLTPLTTHKLNNDGSHNLPVDLGCLASHLHRTIPYIPSASHSPTAPPLTQPHTLSSTPSHPHTTHIFNDRCTALSNLTWTVQPSLHAALLEETAGAGTTVTAVVSRGNRDTLSTVCTHTRTAVECDC